MYCPKCSMESVDGQRFCKACGANLQIVSEALDGGADTLGQLRQEFDGFRRQLKESGRQFAGSMKREARRFKGDVKDGDWQSALNFNSPKKPNSWEPYQDYFPKRQVPRPRDWLRYSRQHSLKEGLVSLFVGGGLGLFTYFLGDAAIHSGTIAGIEQATHGAVQGLEPIVRMLWLVGAIPVLKGVGQIIYGGIFGQSLNKLASTFAPPAIQITNVVADPGAQQPAGSQTANLPNSQPNSPIQTEPIAPAASESLHTPASVTEQTTHFLEGARKVAQ